MILRANWRRYWKLLRFLDAATDARVSLGMWFLRKAVRRTPPMRILLAATQVPGRELNLAQVIAKISDQTNHHVTVAVRPMEPVGKFENINGAISGPDLANFDWMLIVDDDVVVPKGFLDRLLYFAHTHDLKLVQPAHRFLSYSTFAITERHWASLVRRVGFIEIGPVTLLHRNTFHELIPFPNLRWAWGIDVFWAQMAKRNGWRMGIVDASPIRHLRPVGGSYNTNAAREEGEDFLRAYNVTINMAELFETNCRIA
jgi:hypothetical protein